MGASTSSTNSNSTSDTQTNQNFLSMPINPQWVTDGLQGLGGDLSSLTKLDPSSLVAGPSALETQAGNSAAGLTSSPGFGDALSMFQQAGAAGPNTYRANLGGASTYSPTTGSVAADAAPASLLDNLNGYMSPYTDKVVNSALADYDYGAGQTAASNALNLAGMDDTFGGSNGSLATAMTNNDIVRGRGTLSAQLRDQAFQTGANLSNEDAQRRQDASEFNAQQANQFSLANMAAANAAGQFNAGSRNQLTLANMDALNSAGSFNASQAEAALQRELAAAGGLSSTATAQGNDARQNVDTQTAIGQLLQQIQQAQAQAPLTKDAVLSSIWQSLPLSLLKGQIGNTNGTSDTQQTGNSTTTKAGFGLSWSPSNGFSIGAGS